jgi:C4-type Zn-finger protein
MTPKEIVERTRRIANDNLDLAAAGITVVVILCDEEGNSAIASRGNPGIAQSALESYVEDNDLAPEGWTKQKMGSA